ncbi:NUDIX domain-containing protein [Uliginosibacterium gangwonense]|uniref:NUDIX domain-containing protein n=1 Tax=Uliginosibacterium gangwonense TaxID=392736 RepID=UPI001B7F9E96|nr:NUDIX hydrolase [Uliginosibacterium gangwonense]
MLKLSITGEGKTDITFHQTTLRVLNEYSDGCSTPFSRTGSGLLAGIYGQGIFAFAVLQNGRRELRFYVSDPVKATAQVQQQIGQLRISDYEHGVEADYTWDAYYEFYLRVIQKSKKPAMEGKELEITTTESNVVYRNRWMTVREDKILRAGDVPGIYGVVEKTDFAVIAAIEGEQIYLVEQYRYPLKARYWELPQGSCEDESLPPLELAKRELREETGLVAASMQHIGHLFVAVGYSSQGYDVFLASGLSQQERDLEPEEAGLVVKAFNIAEVKQMILDGVIRDATAVATFGLLSLRGVI